MFDYKTFKKEMIQKGFEVNKFGNYIVVYANPHEEITQYSKLICHTSAYRQKRLEFLFGDRDGKAIVFAKFRIREETESGNPVIDEIPCTVEKDETGIIKIHAADGKNEIVLYGVEQAEWLIATMK